MATNNTIEQQKREDIPDDSNDIRINGVVTNKEIEAIENILQSNLLPLNEDPSKKKQKSTLTPKRFTNSVELLVEYLELSYSDAIILCADYYTIELSAINKFMVPQIVEKLKIEAIANRMLPRDSNIDPLVFA